MNKPENLDRNALIARADAAAQELREYEAGCNELRQLHPRSVEIMRDSGLFQLVQPKRLGGFESDIPTLQAVSRSLSNGCASSGWVYLVTGAHTWVLAMFPESAQDHIKAEDPHTFLPGTLASQGKAQIVDGGVSVSGRWQFASGCDHADWGLFCAMQSDSTRDDPKHVHVLVPARDYTIIDTWHTLGLRGTGSKDVVMEDVFVPREFTMPTGDLFEGVSEPAKAHESFHYQFPVLCSLTFLLTAPALAMANRIYDEFVSLTASRRDRYDGSSKAKKATLQARVAESWAEIQAAEALAKEITEIYDRAAADRKPFDLDTRVEVKWRASYAVRLCRRAADRLFDAAGANSIYETSPMLPLFQSLHTASHHAACDFDNNAASFGSNALGLGPGTWLV